MKASSKEPLGTPPPPKLSITTTGMVELKFLTFEASMM